MQAEKKLQIALSYTKSPVTSIDLTVLFSLFLKYQKAWLIQTNLHTLNITLIPIIASVTPEPCQMPMPYLFMPHTE